MRVLPVFVLVPVTSTQFSRKPPSGEGILLRPSPYVTGTQVSAILDDVERKHLCSQCGAKAPFLLRVPRYCHALATWASLAVLSYFMHCPFLAVLRYFSCIAHFWRYLGTFHALPIFGGT